ncbi:TPA: hypothetical protein ACH3X3_006577 [Trebouxia sp. C0006]
MGSAVCAWKAHAARQAQLSSLTADIVAKHLKRLSASSFAGWQQRASRKRINKAKVLNFTLARHQHTCQEVLYHWIALGQMRQLRYSFLEWHHQCPIGAVSGNAKKKRLRREWGVWRRNAVASARQKRADIDIKHPVMHHGPKHTAHSQAMEVPVRSPAATTDNHSKVVNVAGTSVVHPIKKPHHLFTDAIKEVKQQAAQSPSRQTGQPKQVGKALQDIHEAAANSLTVDSNSSEPPCASLQAQANSRLSLTSSDQDTVTTAEKKYLADQPRLQDSRRGHNSLLAASTQANSSSMIKVPQSHNGAAANSLAADNCSSMGHLTKDAAPPQPAKTDPLQPHESFSNTGQYQPLKGMAQGLRRQIRQGVKDIFRLETHEQDNLLSKLLILTRKQLHRRCMQEDAHCTKQDAHFFVDLFFK